MSEASKLLIKKYYDEHSLVESNINSFNNFAEVELHNIVKEFSEIKKTKSLKERIWQWLLKED